MTHAGTSLVLLTWLCTWGISAQEMPAEQASPLDAYDVSWDVPGPSAQESMPIGNGDIGLNVWTEPNGDVLFYIGKTDSWDESVRGSQGLRKVGRVRIALDPRPLTPAAPFHQTLKLRQGEILINEGSAADGATLRLWVDANQPVIRVETISRLPRSVTITNEEWRTGDTVVANAGEGRVAWYRRNGPRADAAVVNLTYGAAITGSGLVNLNARTLRSATPANDQVISIHPLTALTATADAWLTNLDRQVTATGQLALEPTRVAHRAWWKDFWQRSWIFASGEPTATDVTRGYLLQRFITACAGRGAYPIKFNGSIFQVDDPLRSKDHKPAPVEADYRDWGGQYWFQNTRAMYWPRLAAGDFDLMLPLFRMYAAILPANTAQVKDYYHHDGCYFAETAPFWGGLKYVGPEVPENWTDHYFTPILELSMMMLDYYDFTQDAAFAKATLLPVAAAGITFFDQHFSRDAQGKLLLDPDNAIEMYWKVHNPAPDIAALRAVLPRLIALPDALANELQRGAWRRFLGELPPLPTAEIRRKKILLPYTGPQTAKRRNGENPELYAVYPFRLFGLDRPDLDLAITTFQARRCQQKGCWSQDPIQAAMLGLTGVAKEFTTFALLNRAPSLKFPAFWAHGCDYQPDQDNGGNGENGLQNMLLGSDGKNIFVLPAWPKEWDVHFKLNAPYRTTVEGTFEHGTITNLMVTPSSRRADVVECWKRPVWSEPVRPLPGLRTGEVISKIRASDAIAAVGMTVAGGPTHVSEARSGEGVKSAIDGSLDSKYYNTVRNPTTNEAAGVGSGSVISLSAPAALSTFQIATANDVPGRDPLAITIEGSNDPAAAQDGATGFTLLYDGLTGIDVNPGRKAWGPAIGFPNQTAYRTYRILATEARALNGDGIQYSEMRLGTLGQ